MLFEMLRFNPTLMNSNLVYKFFEHDFVSNLSEETMSISIEEYENLIVKPLVDSYKNFNIKN
jgi:hypothetical protein